MTLATHGPERRYGKALYDLAKQEGKVAEVAAGLDALTQAITAQPDAQALLTNPVITRRRKEEFLAQVVTKAGAGDLLRRFVSLVARKGRAETIGTMTHWFHVYRMADEGTVVARVASAAPLTDAQRADVAAFVQRKTAGAKKVQLQESVAPELIGGLRILVGSQQFDASVRGRLERLAASLKN